MKKCKECGKTLKKEERTVCYPCHCAKLFAKNGGNTSRCRAKVAIKHLNASKPGLFEKIFGLA